MDVRVTYSSKDDLDIDDKDYLVKLLSKLPIVKWQPPRSLGPLKREKMVTDEELDYKTLDHMDFKPGLHMEISNPAYAENIDISRHSFEVLNQIFQPQYWIDNKERFIQNISLSSASRLETALLNDGIRALMIQAQARAIGICPIRENLVLRCFDEMIRLATVDSAERGLLMRTVRNDIRMSLCCYRTLVEHAIDFGNRKFGEALHAVEQLNKDLAHLKQEKQRYQFENQEMRIKMQLMDRKNLEERQAVLEFRKNKLATLKRTNDQFIQMLDQVGVEKNTYRHLL